MPADALANRWETARRYAAELDAGRSQRETARLVGKDHKHVGWMAEVWREHGGDLGPQKPFNRYYQAAKKAVESGRKTTPAPNPAGANPADSSEQEAAPAMHIFEILTPRVNPRVVCITCCAEWDHGRDDPAQRED